MMLKRRNIKPRKEKYYYLHRGFSRLQFPEANLEFSLHVDASVANVDIRLRDGVALSGNSPTLLFLVFLSFY